MRIRKWVPWHWHQGQHVDGHWVWDWTDLRAWWSRWEWLVYLGVIIGLATLPMVFLGI